MDTYEGVTPMGMVEDVGDVHAEADRWNSKGNAYLAVRDYITAISCFDLALKTHPGSDQEDIYLSNRATAQFRIGNYEAAVDGFRQASLLRPKKHSHFTCLGKVYLRWGGHGKEALEALEESLRLEHTSVAANLAAKARVASHKASQWQAGGGRSPPRPHPPHRNPEHLTRNAPRVQDFSKPTGPLVKMSSTKIRGLLRNDSRHGGVAMISSGDSIRSDATAALGGGGLVRDNSTKTAGVKGTGGCGGGGGSNGSDDGGSRKGSSVASGYLLEIMQNRAHFDGDDDDDDDDDEVDEEEEKEEEIGASDQKIIGAKGNAVVRSVPPRAAPPRPGGRAAGTPRRHRKRPSRDSISSLVAAESVGIVATIAAARPTATSTTAGTGVVARAVARVEDRPEDEAVKSILAKAAQKQLAEDAARARNKMLAPPRANAAGPRPPPPPYPGRTVAAGSTREDSEREGERQGEPPPESAGRANGFSANGSAAGPEEPPSSLEGGGGSGSASGGNDAALAQTPASAVAVPAMVASLEERRAGRRFQPPPPSPGGSEFSVGSDRRLVARTVARAKAAAAPGPSASGDDAAELLSSQAAIQAVAEVVRSMSSVNQSMEVAAAEEAAEAAEAAGAATAEEGAEEEKEKPSAAALAAIAHGAAPVKWGKEGAEERRAAAAASAAAATGATVGEDAPPGLSRRGSGSSSGSGSIVDGSTFFAGPLDNDNGDHSDKDAKHGGVGGRGGGGLASIRSPLTMSSNKAGSSVASDWGTTTTRNITPPPPPSYEAAEEAARLGVAPRTRGWGPGSERPQAGGGGEFSGFPDDTSNRSWHPGDYDDHGGGGRRHGSGGSGETRRHGRRASEGSAMYREDEEGSQDGEEGIVRTSSLMMVKPGRRQQRQILEPEMEVFLDNEEGEWGQAPTSRFWRLWWPGRSRRHVPIGICLDSPNVARASLNSGGAGQELMRFPWDKDEHEEAGDNDDEVDGSRIGSVGSARRVDPRVFLSTGSEPSKFDTGVNRPRSQSHRPLSTAEEEAGRLDADRHLSGVADVGCFQRSHSSNAVVRGVGNGTRNGVGSGSAGVHGGGQGRRRKGGRKRLRRWVTRRKGGGGGRGAAIPGEEEVEEWMRAVLGSRALGLLDRRGGSEDGGSGGSDEGLVGGRGLAEELKDGRLLVRLAHAVGGSRTAGMLEDLEAATPMIQLVNLQAFLAAARAIGVPAASLFHAKDVVDAPPGGPCSPAVLNCLAALSDAVRRNAATDPSGDAYDGPLLGDEDIGGGTIKEEEGEEDAAAVIAGRRFGGGGGAGGSGRGSARDGDEFCGSGRVVGSMVAHHDVDGLETMTTPDSSTLSVGPSRFLT